MEIFLNLFFIFNMFVLISSNLCWEENMKIFLVERIIVMSENFEIFKIVCILLKLNGEKLK